MLRHSFKFYMSSSICLFQYRIFYISIFIQNGNKMEIML